MSKLDRQHRLNIPSELLSLVSIHNSDQVSVNYDFDTHSLYLDKLDINSNAVCIGYRVLDLKGRLTLSKSFLELIDADYASDFIVYVRYGHLHISKLTKTPDI